MRHEARFGDRRLHKIQLARRRLPQGRSHWATVESHSAHDPLEPAERADARRHDRLDQPGRRRLGRASRLQIATSPGGDQPLVERGGEVVGAADGANGSGFEPGEEFLVATEHDIESAVSAGEAGRQVVERLVRKLHAGQSRNAVGGGLEKVARADREVGDRRKVVIEEGCRRGGRGDLMTPIHQAWHALGMEEVRCQAGDPPRADRFGMVCQAAAVGQAGRSDVDDHPEVSGRGGHPALSHLSPFIERQRRPLTGCATDKPANHSLAGQEFRVGIDTSEVEFAIRSERRERGGNQTRRLRNRHESLRVRSKRAGPAAGEVKDRRVPPPTALAGVRSPETGSIQVAAKR